MFTGALVVGFFMGLIIPEAFLAIAGPIVGYYFSEKKQDQIIEELRLRNPKSLLSEEELRRFDDEKI